MAQGKGKRLIKKDKDPLHAFLRSLGERGGVIPPFAMELILVDGMFYYVHSVERAPEDSVSISIRIWDTRNLDDKELGRLRKTVSGLSDASSLADPTSLHPALDWGTLRVDMDRISYCVEWHHALWPVDRKKATRSRLH
jgi:hypothetical protein